MTFTEHYDAVCLMYYCISNNYTKDDTIQRIKDKLGYMIGNATFYRMKDDMCHVFRCSLQFNKKTNCYTINYK